MNDINNDTNLREAVNRREQHLPTMPADLNERLMQRLQVRLMSDGTLEAPQFKKRQIRLYAAVAASILFIICIGTALFTDKPVQVDTMVAENNAQPLTSHQGVGSPKGGVGSLTSTPSESFAENCHEKRLQAPPRPSGTPLLDGRGKATGRRVSGNSAARSIAKHELPDTLGDGIWQSEDNVVRAMQILGECEAVIQKSEQEMRNNIIKCTYNATPQPANAVLVTNEAGDCEVIESKTIIEI